MTIEQLEQANEICSKLEKLREIYGKLKNEYYTKEVLTFKNGRTCFENIKDNAILDLGQYPELTRVILEYISDQIKALEKQLEEL